MSKKIDQRAFPRGSYTVGPDVDLETEDIRDGNGERIDDAYVEQVIQRVGAQIASREAGRPSLSADGEVSPQVSFRMPRTMRAKAKQRADAEGKTISALARDALEQYLQAS